MDGSIRIRILKKGLNKGKKVYDVYYRYMDKETGKVKQTSKKGFLKKSEAEKFLNQVQHDIANNKFIPNKDITVKTYLVEWYKKEVAADPDLKQTTKDGYRVNIDNHIIPKLGDKQLLEITKTDVQTFYWQLLQEKRLSSNTIRYVHRVFSRTMEEAVQNDIIPKNVLKYCKVPGESNFKARTLNKDQLKNLLRFVNGTELYFTIALAALCGLRRGEVLGLKWTDVNLDTKIIDVKTQLVPTSIGNMLTTPKTKTSIRKVPIPKTLTMELKEHRQRQES